MIVSNTSPIINLACIGRLDLLPALFGVITIPDAVFHEIAVANPDAPGASDVRTASWIRRYAVVNRPLVTSLRLELDPGEAEAIACAMEPTPDCCWSTSAVVARLPNAWVWPPPACWACCCWQEEET